MDKYALLKQVYTMLSSVNVSKVIISTTLVHV